jgi:hypothetical protein
VGGEGVGGERSLVMGTKNSDANISRCATEMIQFYLFLYRVFSSRICHHFEQRFNTFGCSKLDEIEELQLRVSQ